MAIDGKPVVLSLAFNFHDSNCALSIGNEIVNALELERLFRSKRFSASISHMEIAAKYLLKRNNITPQQVDHLVVNALNNPFDGIQSDDDVRETSYRFMGINYDSFVLRHHLAHAGHYYFSPYENALISSCDGGGDLGERVAYFAGTGIDLKRLEIDTTPHTSTKPYGQISAYLFGEAFAEGKLMAIAGLGIKSDSTMSLVSDLYPRLKNVTFKSGQQLLSRHLHSYQGSAATSPQDAADVAYAVQQLFVDRRVCDILKIFDGRMHQNLVIVGGSALNLACNTQIYSKITKKLYIPPCCDDTGIAIGQAAVVIAWLTGKRPTCQLPYTAIDEPKAERERYFSRLQIPCDIIYDAKAAALRIAKGDVCIAHIGNPEIGPRALGHRSFFASADLIKKELVSCAIKKREWYRPVAPVVLEENLEDYFKGGPDTSPFMLHSYQAKEVAHKEVPGAIHLDGTARVQSINQNNNSLYELLHEYRSITGNGVLLNTSLNLKGQPISNFSFDTLEIARKIHVGSFIFTDE